MAQEIERGVLPETLPNKVDKVLFNRVMEICKLVQRAVMVGLVIWGILVLQTSVTNAVSELKVMNTGIKEMTVQLDVMANCTNEMKGALQDLDLTIKNNWIYKLFRSRS